MLRAVRAAVGAVSVAELAEELAVHPNTVRFHLESLQREGRIEQVAAVRAGRGRPALRYRPIDDGEGERQYELLAGILAAGLERADQGRERAADAGFAWGLARARSIGRQPVDAVRELVLLLEDVGFAPSRPDPDTVELRNCPFRDTVAEHEELVCGIHAGLMRGALAGWHAPTQVAALEPFAEPGICLARLRTAGAA